MATSPNQLAVPGKCANVQRLTFFQMMLKCLTYRFSFLQPCISAFRHPESFKCTPRTFCRGHWLRKSWKNKAKTIERSRKCNGALVPIWPLALAASTAKVYRHPLRLRSLLRQCWGKWPPKRKKGKRIKYWEITGWNRQAVRLQGCAPSRRLMLAANNGIRRFQWNKVSLE